MCKILSVINNKGGCAKTTTTAIVGEILAYTGAKVLVVDLDHQSNLSMLLNCYNQDNEKVINHLEQPAICNIAELFRHRYRTREELVKLVQATAIPNLYIIPSSKRHKYTADDIRKNTGNNNVILKRALNALRNDYDYILIDNAPASDILTVNSIFASDYVIVPIRIENFSYKGLRETIESILYIKDEHELETVEFLGAFITQAEINTNLYKSLEENYRKELGNKFFTTPIRKDIKIAEIETAFRPILEYAPNANAVFDYCTLLIEMNILSSVESNILKSSIGL